MDTTTIPPSTVQFPGSNEVFWTLVAGSVAILLIVSLMLVLTRAIMKASESSPPNALVLALAVLTALSIAGGITTDNDEAWAIAAAGIGALAGSVTSLFQIDQKRKKDAEESRNSDNGGDKDSPGE